MNDNCIYKGMCDIECTPRCMKYLEMNYLLETSNIPKSKRKINTLIPDSIDVKAFEKLADIRDNIVDFVQGGKSLYIFSNKVGNGKTTWAIKLMLQYFNEVWAGNGFKVRGIFVNVPTFLTMNKNIISLPDRDFEVMREELSYVDLVIFDDIASTKLSDYDYNMLLTYIDQRVVGEKAIIYTGNIIPDHLNDYVGDRLASRICGKNGMRVMLKGSDKR